MPSLTIKIAIRAVYEKHPDAADPIANNPQKASDFTNQVNMLLPKEQQLSVAECSRILINMRRKGGDNGGLPPKFGRRGPRPGSGGGHGSKA